MLDHVRHMNEVELRGMFAEESANVAFDLVKGDASFCPASHMAFVFNSEFSTKEVCVAKPQTGRKEPA